jgi:asparagine synthase (glutamine-hydrolysing)
MCGIAGGTHIGEEPMHEALGLLRHRGPDAQCSWHERGAEVSFGHNRLAIIDLNAEANQPMHCPRTGNIVVFNGEIYNFRAIRNELTGIGWEFRTKSDTEVLLAAYGQWGADCVIRLNGMFAFVLYDAKQQALFAARDRAGKKPLYYTLWNGGFVWASELKALLALQPEMPRTLDQEALRDYMDIGYIQGERTIYRSVRKLLPAHYGVYDLRTHEFSPFRYWSLPTPQSEVVNYDEAAEKLEWMLADSVRLRLESDVPIGILLSGGLDSCLVAAFAAKENPEMVAYTAQFAIDKYDETSVARRVAEWIGIKHSVAPIDSVESGNLEVLGRQFDEPFADSSLLPTYLVSKAIHQHVKVALSGDGGDELFGGYEFYRSAYSERKLARIPRPMRAMASPIHHLMPHGMPGKNLMRRIKYDGIERYRQVSLNLEHVPHSPLVPGLAKLIDCMPADTVRRAIQCELETMAKTNPAMTLLQQMTRLDFLTYLPDDVLVKVDRASMLTSLEVRCPLLDYRIIEFAFSLPDRLRYDGIVRKVLMKRVGKKYLPPDFPFERKQGFNIPVGEWFRADWKSLLPQLLDKGTTIFNKVGVKRIEEMHDRTGRYGYYLFRLLMLALFEQNYRVSLDG